MAGIIILEGADACGKTTLAHAFGGAAYLHQGISDEVWDYHYQTVRVALRLAKDGRLVVLDRLWLSEQVYGQAYRDGPAYDFGARYLDQLLCTYGAITVLCSPIDAVAQADRHAARAAGGGEAFKDPWPSIHLYEKLRKGDPTHPGNTYLDELIRVGNYADNVSVIPYDLDVDGKDVQGFAERTTQLASLVWRPLEDAQAMKEAMV